MAGISIILKAEVDKKSHHYSNAQPLRVLFIGNSYTYYNNLPNLTRQLALSAKESRKLETEMVTVGGATLEKLWNQGKALSRIRSRQWDYVVLQEQSTLPITNPQLMYEYVRLFNAEIRQANAKTVFYLTWARQHRPETQQALNDSYMTIAKELNAILAPVGIVWQQIQQENSNLSLYNPDKSHPSSIGSYVAACVFYAIFYGNSPEGLSYKNGNNKLSNLVKNSSGELESLKAADIELIQRLSWDVVRKFVR
ncbi:MAG: SGNH/GDSL hydrolase family protein [Aulosira sp. ZfuVER01]|nr:hypothetical protein [Aulosira sp. ZfuVER01]MDZ7996652.1 hypothetical protein [Aulosira sp. DedVER01a]MDZ8056408.1 hypothetical protein [Aulosira sp. ZfuCHP01]